MRVTVHRGGHQIGGTCIEVASEGSRIILDAGLPLEIYCFTSDIRWDCYEAVQSDIFDHLLAILPEFDLRVFQSSSDAPRDVRLHDPRSARPGA